MTIADRALPIYTSGTTGLPKAANVSHRRLLQWSFWFAGLMDTGPDDRMYDCLPMYHSVGGVVATGALLVSGGSVVIRDKFSASSFWDDVADWDCTLFQYIGELCRYLVNAPQHPRERAASAAAVLRQRPARRHLGKVPGPLRDSAHPGILCGDRRQRLALQRRGQGRRHRPRSAVPRASLPAGAGQIRRRSGRTGARRRRLLHPLRDRRGRRGDRPESADGHRSRRGDSKAIPTPRSPSAKSCATCSTRGDAWYRTGDLMRMDAAGFYYFVDRIGDTFRWKGENVATSEVAAAITAFPGIADAVVYGVHVPGTEGRAGMAAHRRRRRTSDLAALRSASCAAAAAPMRGRCSCASSDGIAVTSTFKHRRASLRAKVSIRPRRRRDLFRRSERSKLVPLDAALYERIRGRRDAALE